MALHPCFGGSLKTGVKIIAGIQIVCGVLAVIGIGLISIGFTYLTVIQQNNAKASESDAETDSFNDTSVIMVGNLNRNDFVFKDGKPYMLLDSVVKNISQLTISMLIVSLATTVYFLVIAIDLWKGAKEENFWRCNSWFRLHVANLVVSLISVPLIYSITSLSQNSNDEYSRMKCVLPFSIGISFLASLYFLWVVHAFMKEIRSKIIPTYEKQVNSKY